MIDKKYLIEAAAHVIYNNKGQLRYETIHQVLQGQVNWPLEHIAIFYLEGSIICHNIPVYDKITKQRCLREPSKCLSSFLRFANTNKDENELVNKSQTGFAEENKITGSYIIPKLKFADNTHEILKAGKGGPLPDFIGSDGKTYEAKFNYMSGSPSSLHDADILIAYINPAIAAYPIYNNHAKISSDNLLVSYKDILSPKYEISNIQVDDYILEWLNSGELILPVEKLLKEKTSFRWPD